MTWIIGTDEAGYGPNLGPLCVCATCWHAMGWENRFVFPDDTQALILHMNEALTPISGRKGLFPLIDSKKLYHSSGGLAALERSVLIALLLLKRENYPDTFTDLTRSICGEKETANPVFCEVGFNPRLPFDPNTNSGEALQVRATKVQALFDSLQLQLRRVACRRVQPEEFNAMLRLGLKSDLIARVTLGLIRQTIEAIQQQTSSRKGQGASLLTNTTQTDRGEDCVKDGENRLQQRSLRGELLSEPIIVLCDKLGGRNNYRRELEEHFPTFIIEVVEESRALSRYLLLQDERRVEIRFQMKGEANIPTALASIFDKYLRELSMVAFNQWWSARLPGLTPTAGYPVDAKRFLADISGLLSQENDSDKISMSVLWRQK